MSIIRPLALLRSPWGIGLLLLLLTSSLCSATAQSSVDELTELPVEELLRVKVLKVYGASRYEQKALEAPANVSVITAEDIRRYGYRTIADLLQGVTGIYISSDSGYQYLGYRGFSIPGDFNTRALVLVDGVRLNDAVYHQASVGYDLPLDISLIYRVEVIRGPSQAIYGNNAYLLVVNIVTRPTSFQRQHELGLFVDTTGQTRTTATTNGLLGENGPRLLLSGSYFQSPGTSIYLSAYDSPATNNGITGRNRDAMTGGSLYFKLDYEALTMSAGYQQGVKQLPLPWWGSTFNDAETKGFNERYFANIGYTLLERNQGVLRARAYLNGNRYTGSFAFTPGPVVKDNSNAVTVGGELQGDLHLPGNHHLVAGVDIRYDAAMRQWNSNGFDDNHTNLGFGLFVQDEWRLLPDLLLFAGGRYDYLGNGLHTISPKAGVTWLATEQLALKYLFGRSFRAPNALERYYGAEVYVPNPSLKEEALISHELIAEYQLGERMRLVLNGFQYDYRDLIVLSQLANSSYQFVNAERYQTRGGELELSANWFGWSGMVGYTYQHTYCVNHGNEKISNSPAHLLKLRLSRELLGPRLILSGELQYISRLLSIDPAVSVGDALQVNLQLASRDLLLKGLDASVGIYNLFDRQYSLPVSQAHLPTVALPADGIRAGFRLSYHF